MPVLKLQGAANSCNEFSWVKINENPNELGDLSLVCRNKAILEQRKNRSGFELYTVKLISSEMSQGK